MNARHCKSTIQILLRLSKKHVTCETRTVMSQYRCTRYSDLQTLWQSVCNSASNSQASTAVVDKWWQEILERYSEKQRHYHTLSHISDMIDLWEEKHAKLKEASLVALAIFFHDIVYDPKAGDNEKKSAVLFEKFGDEIKLEPSITAKITQWILLTKTHNTEVHTIPGMFGLEDHHYLLDMDMAVLGCSKDKYFLYSKQIRQEYSHVPHVEYCDRRAKVLESFLKTPNIFATDSFRITLERQARDNLQDEILQLRAKYSEPTA